MSNIYTHLTIEERTMIQAQLEMGIEPVAIALKAFDFSQYYPQHFRLSG